MISDDSAMAIYWFAKWAGSVRRKDYILASVARDKLRDLGWDVRDLTRARRSRGNRKVR